MEKSIWGMSDIRGMFLTFNSKYLLCPKERLYYLELRNCLKKMEGIYTGATYIY
jgi:hypothetical protein